MANRPRRRMGEGGYEKMAETRTAKGRRGGDLADAEMPADTRACRHAGKEEFRIRRSEIRRASRPPGPHAEAGCLTRLWPMADPAVTIFTLSSPQECGNTTPVPIHSRGGREPLPYEI